MDHLKIGINVKWLQVRHAGETCQRCHTRSDQNPDKRGCCIGARRCEVNCSSTSEGTAHGSHLGLHARAYEFATKNQDMIAL